MMISWLQAVLEHFLSAIIDVLIVFFALPLATLLYWLGLWRKETARVPRRPERRP